MAKTATAWFVVHPQTHGFLRRKGDNAWKPFQSKKKNSFVNWSKAWIDRIEHRVFELDGWQFAVPIKKAQYITMPRDENSKPRDYLSDLRRSGRMNARFRRSRRR